MKIIISPWSQKLSNGKENPKNYPWWQELINLLQSPDNQIIQVGVTGEKIFEGVLPMIDLPYPKLIELIKSADIFFSVDNFFPHFANCYGKYGVVLWGRSNPELFGYNKNLNIYKDKKYFRPDQFGLWESCERIEDAFVRPAEVLAAMNAAQ